MKIFIISSCITCLLPFFSKAQDYHAINGSSYVGSLSVHNNPASTLSTPYKWDLTLIGVQAKATTNIVSIQKYSLLSAPSKSEYFFSGGSYERKGILNANINLLNARISLNRKTAIAFGANMRLYGRISTSEYDFIDTLKNVGSFLKMNERLQPLSGDFTQSGWVEIYGSLARTVIDNEFGRLNVGATLKLSRGISGAHASLQNARFIKNISGNQTEYTSTQGTAIYGYSSNYDRWNNDRSSNQNIRDFLTTTQGGASIDIGAEYTLKPQAVVSVMDDDAYYDYDWKFGASILDLGANQYRYGLQSRQASGIQPNITSIDINNKMDSTVRSMRIFNDSLEKIVQSFAAPTGTFRVLNPTRLVLNADRFVYGAFYVNAEVSINLSGIFGKKWQYVKQMNAVTVTPRWETSRWGVYMPVSITTEKNFWVGAAAKVGPLLVGLHNLAYIFSTKSIHKGGGYIALIIHAFNDTNGRGDRRLNCPPDRF